MTSYARTWSASRPGCLIFLLDQSGSMSEQFGFAQAGAGRRKCDMVATVLNGFLNELIVTNTTVNKNGTMVRPRADIAVLGYEGAFVGPVLPGALQNKDFVTLPELQMHPLTIERRKKKEIDETGMEIEIAVPFPIWVQPVAEGGTPMCEALRLARDLASLWAMNNPDSYPPVIINVSDGMATDGDPAETAGELSDVGTNDGQALLFNVHITDIGSAPIAYPASEYELPNDPYAKKLFAMSSLIPESSRELLQTLTGRTISSRARGMIFNGDAASVRQMFVFASVPATKQLETLDPNR